MKLKINSDLRNAKNIGATIEKYLDEIGIFTLADLAEITSVEVFKRITLGYAGDKSHPLVGTSTKEDIYLLS